MLIKLSDVGKYSHTKTLMKVKTEVVLCLSGCYVLFFPGKPELFASALGDQIPSIHLFTMFLVIEITHVENVPFSVMVHHSNSVCFIM